MSFRRFAAYFFAVAAGSTVVFAPILRGQPAPPATRDGWTVRTAADDGADELPAETVRLSRMMRNHRHHRPGLKAAR